MNIAFLTDEFYPDFGANSLIVKTICRVLAQKGHKVYVLPAGFDPKLPRRESFEGITVVRELPHDSKQAMVEAAKELRLVKAAKCFAMLVGSRVLGIHSLWHKRRICARDYLEKFVKEQEIQTVVSINCSVELAFPLLFLREKGKLPCKWLFYMLDPFESHEYYRAHNSLRRLRKLQHRIMTACDSVLATELIYRDAAQWEEKAVLDKIRIAEFPKIEKPEEAPAEDDVQLVGEGLQVVCTGTKNEQVRSSAYTLAVCKKISGATFHFVGPGWAEEEPVRDGNLVFYPPHSHQAVRNMQRNADFLLNIGNVVVNQLPSKVLEYISMGKPVINIYKSEACPAKALLKSWDGLNISEAGTVAAAQEKLTAFLKEMHASVPFAEIVRRYPQYTPEAVAELFLIN